MAFFVVVVDPDRERRERFLAAARIRIPSFVPLVADEARLGPFGALWARPAAAPTDAFLSDERFALVLGDAFTGPGGRRVAARDLLARPGGGTARRDGFHVAVRRDGDGTVEIEADLLGIFPVHHVRVGDVFLAASTPDVLRRHPLVRVRLDPVGLAGLLLANGQVGGRTLFAGVRRLPAGCMLRRSADGAVTEVERDPLPRGEALRARSLDETVDALGAAMEGAVRRHVPPGTPCGLLLSGGLDSRLLAGYLAQQGHAVRAISMGLSHETDARLGTRVAAHLGFAHQREDFLPSLHPDLVSLCVHHEGLAAGAASVDRWFFPRLPLGGLPRTVLGVAMDSIAGPAFSQWALLPGETEPSLAGAMAFTTGWGLPPPTLRRLLRAEVCGDAVDEALAGLREEWNRGECPLDARAWRFALLHRQRFHTGSMAFALAFGSWPALPAVDGAVLATAFAEPRATIAERRAQRALLCRRFPALAALPLDRNDWDSTPLLPSPPARARAWIRRHLPWARRLERAWRRRHGDPRRYHRIYDVNGAAWRLTRTRAEVHRAAGHAWLHADVLRELLPPPDVPLLAADSVAGTTGAKNLAAFLLWLGEVLSGSGAPADAGPAAP